VAKHQRTRVSHDFERHLIEMVSARRACERVLEGTEELMAVNNKSDFWLFLESPPLSTVRFNQTITWSSNRVPQQSVVRQKKLASSPVLEKGKALH
jgi:hypothetical protein